jgi:hypothetical protein
MFAELNELTHRNFAEILSAMRRFTQAAVKINPEMGVEGLDLFYDISLILNCLQKYNHDTLELSKENKQRLMLTE